MTDKPCNLTSVCVCTVGDDDCEPFTTTARLPAPLPMSASLGETDDSSLVPPGDSSSMMAIEEVEMDD